MRTPHAGAYLSMPHFIRICALVWLGACATSAQARPLEEPAFNAEERPAQAPDDKTRFHLLFTLGFQFGGDALVDVFWSDGGKSSLNAGDALVVAAGGLVEPFGGTTHVLQLQSTLGYNYTQAEASNGSAVLTHWPLELLAFYQYRPAGLRAGGGLQYQLGASFKGTGALASGSTSFDNALGLVLQADWLPTSWLSFYLRYTFINYSPPGSSVQVSGGGIGFGMSVVPRIL